MKKLIAMICCLALVLSTVAACAPAAETTPATATQAPAAAEKQPEAAPATEAPAEPVEAKKLVISLDFTPETNTVKTWKYIAENVQKRTNGSVVMEIYDSAALGSQREALEGMLVGTINGTCSLEPISYWVPDINIFSIPYLFESEDEMKAFFEGELGEEMNQKIIAAGFQPIGYYPKLSRQVTANKIINSVDDLAGLKIRVPETQSGPICFEAMGAKPITLPYAELFSALQQGVVDGQENPLNQIYTAKFYEVQTCIAMTNHCYSANYFLLDEPTWQTLTAEEQQIILDVAAEAREFDAKIIQQEVDLAMKAFEEAGITITYPDTSAFAEKAADAYASFDETLSYWVNKIKG